MVDVSVLQGLIVLQDSPRRSPWHRPPPTIDYNEQLFAQHRTSPRPPSTGSPKIRARSARRSGTARPATPHRSAPAFEQSTPPTAWKPLAATPEPSETGSIAASDSLYESVLEQTRKLRVDTQKQHRFASGAPMGVVLPPDPQLLERFHGCKEHFHSLKASLRQGLRRALSEVDVAGEAGTLASNACFQSVETDPIWADRDARMAVVRTLLYEYPSRVHALAIRLCMPFLPRPPCIILVLTALLTSCDVSPSPPPVVSPRASCAHVSWRFAHAAPI